MKAKWIKICTVLAIGVLTFALSFSQVFYTFDKVFSDPLYQRPSVTDSRIKIIAIDEKTIEKYGDSRTWSREIWADLIAKLNQQQRRPAVIVMDILFIGEVEAQSDARLAALCEEGRNVLTAVNGVYETAVGQTGIENTYEFHTRDVVMVEFPYDALRNGTHYGFANAVMDKDGYIRYALSSLQYEGETIDSLAIAAYKKYCEVQDEAAEMPVTFEDGLYTFSYSGKNGAYETVSLCDVLDGTVDLRAFSNAIVLVGAYAPGMQDAYYVPIEKDQQMYGVEIHANILEALLEGKTGIRGNLLLYSLCVAAVCVLFFLLCRKMKILPGTVLLAVFIAADFVIGKLLCNQGWVISIIEIPVFLAAIYIGCLAHGYLTETMRRRKTVEAFKKYVSPQIVDEMAKTDAFQVVLGGETRDIAVLFVDIRGFTTLSEQLEPEQVVEILNAYFALVTRAVFQYGGTLDKYIGDAAMAVFNAPFDLDDYVYRAACAAKEIADGTQTLERSLMERFGRSISFGIGIHCGKAVVGNIGCDFRMDYTAIGDTVNTAARLESNAKPGQILISETVAKAVQDRIKVKDVGKMALKGKQNEVQVYQLERE